MLHQLHQLPILMRPTPRHPYLETKAKQRIEPDSSAQLSTDANNTTLRPD
jgi:hypothetical protein